MILDLLYPPFCLHCKTPLKTHCHFCSSCFDEFRLIPEEGRCSKCFSEISMLHGTCRPCRKIAHPFKRFAACFEGYGPAHSLLSAFLKGKQTHLAKELASYFVIQLDKLNYPAFDLIIPIPSHFTNPHVLIARELGKMLKVPCSPMLKKTFSSSTPYQLKKKCNIINQSVLLLCDLTPSRMPFRNAAFALQEGWCETTYGMTLCVT